MLLERDAQMATARGLLGRVGDGAGAVLVVEGEAGSGKTSLLRALRDEAGASGVRVLSARAGEMERGFAFGVARQLLEGLLVEADDAGRERLLAGAARHALPALDDSLADLPAEGDLRALHGLHWLVVNLSDEGPLAIVVDDAHWADAPSLRFLAYLGRRVEDVPVLVALAVRPEAPAAARPVLDELVAEPLTATVRPAPLSTAAVGELAHAELDAKPAPEFVEAAARISGGNPFFLRELVRAARQAGIPATAAGAGRLGDLSPPGVLRAVARRLAALDPADRSLAEALAVLDGPASPALAAAVADLPPADVGEAARRLAQAGLAADGGGLEIAHPLLRSAIVEAMGGARQAELHVRAAEALAVGGGDLDTVALHLVALAPGTPTALDPATVLGEAGRRALARGAPAEAQGLVVRALEEPGAGERADLLLVCARAEMRLGHPRAPARYAAAARAADPGTAARIDLEQMAELMQPGRFAEAVDLARDILAGRTLTDDQREEITVMMSIGGMMDPRCRAGAADHAERVLAADDAREPLTRRERILAMILRSLFGRDSVRAAELAGDLLADPATVAPELRGLAPAMPAALLWGDEAEAALRAYDAMAAGARQGGSLLGMLHGLGGALMARRFLGDLLGAEANGDLILELLPPALRGSEAAWMVYGCVLVMVERGRPEDALALVGDTYAPEPWRPHFFSAVVMEARAQAQLAVNRPEAGLRDALIAGEWATGLGLGSEPVPWRTTAALCLRALGRLDEGFELAREEYGLAVAAAVVRGQGRALRVMGLCRRGPEGVLLLERSVALLADGAAQLELAKSEVELGAALRRDGRRVAAREVLRRGVDRAARCGAVGLAERGREELVAAGARPRRQATTGPAALTAAERRVVELAAEGASNREVAQALFLTQKTVETHLSRAFRKLEVTSRTQLADALAPA